MKQLISLFLATILIGCNSEEAVTPQEEFVKIYDDDEFNEQYEPLDVVETTDGGYLILSFYRRDDSNFRGLYTQKTDAMGDYVSGTKFINDFVSPVKPLMESGGKYYFFCMDQFSLGTRLMELDEAGNVLNSFSVPVTYPMAANMDGQNFVLQSYNHVNRRTILSVVSPTGVIQSSSDFDIGAGEGVEEPIIDHFNQTGRYFPFLAGVAGNGSYYFNGFFNYTLSLVFTDLGGDDPTGVCQGQQAEGGIGAVLPTGNNQFAVSRFNFGDNFINPGAKISTTSVTSSLDLGGNSIPEMVTNASVELKEVIINGKPVFIYATTTYSGQILLMGYDPSTLQLNALEYLGFANPYAMSGFSSTSDGGLIVVGKTFVAGRFPRICLFKLPASRLRKFAN